MVVSSQRYAQNGIFSQMCKTYIIVSWSEIDSFKIMFAKFLSNEDLVGPANANSYENQELKSNLVLAIAQVGDF